MIKPNHVTISGLIITIIAVIINNELTTPLILTALALDVIDGKLARSKGLTTKIGGELDSITDKIIETLIIMHYTTKAGINGALMTGLSIMISYTKIRTNTKTRTIFDRAQRMIYIIIMFTLLNNQLSTTIIMYYTLSIIAISQVVMKAWFA